jgi:hypothetical protein
MKHIAAVSLVFVLIALPAWAQHGAARGGFSGHAAGVSRGGFSASAPARSSGYRGSPIGRSAGIARGYQRGIAGNHGPRSPYTGDLRYRRPYPQNYRAGFPYVVPNYGWPYFLGYPDDSGFDDSSAALDNGAGNDPANAPEGYEAGPPDQYRGQYSGQQEQLAPYQPGPQIARRGTAPASEDAVTLIFKDGRPTEQIHNYILTPTTLYVGDQHHRVIPTDQLDLFATARVNQDAGVDFQLPNAVK